MDPSTTLDGTDREARVFAALADPSRLRVLGALAAGARCVCDLEETLALSQSLLSYHIGVLRRAGLIQGIKRGRRTAYRVAPQELDAAVGAISALRPQGGPG